MEAAMQTSVLLCSRKLRYSGNHSVQFWPETRHCSRFSPESLNLISLHHVADGLTDCSDSKCCSHPSCRTNIMCMYLEDPVEVLLRKPPPAVDAPFLKRVQFLFEGEDSVQNYAKQDTFDDRYVVDEIPSSVQW